MSRSNPWMKFFPADWRSDPALRSVSYCARGLWIECIALMHEADPYGYLTLGGQPITPELLARLTTGAVDEVVRLLAELENARVFSRNKAGVIYCRRMVRDEKQQRISRENGKKGGNPTLCKQTEIQAQDNQPDKGGLITHMPEARIQTPESSLGEPAASKKASRWIEGNEIPDAWIAEAADIRSKAGLPQIDIRLEAEKFVDFWVGKPGKEGVKADWHATWRNWARNARSLTRPNSDRPSDFLPGLNRKKCPGKTYIPGVGIVS